VEKYLVALKASPGAGYGALPPTIREVIEANEIEGGVTLGGSAWVPLKEPWNATHDSILDLPNARGKLDVLGGRVDRLALKLRLGSDIGGADRDPEKQGPATQKSERWPAVLARIEIGEVQSGGSVVRFEKGRIVIDPELNQWRVRQLVAHVEASEDRANLPAVLRKFFAKTPITGKAQITAAAHGPLATPEGKRWHEVADFEAIAYPRNVSVHLRNWPRPFTGITGAVAAGPKLISFQNVEGSYGADRFFVMTARLPLEAIDRQVQLREVSGSMQLSGAVEDYPRPLDGVAKAIHPMGTWYVSGSYVFIKGLPKKEREQFTASVTTDSAGLGLMQTRVPVTDLKTEVTITRDLIDIKRLTAWGLGGELVADGKVALGKPVAFEGNVYMRDLDLKAVAKAMADNGKPPMKLSGKGTVKGTFTAASAHEQYKAEDLIRASGVFEVVEGDFWQIPVMGEVVQGTKTKSDALTVGQAAGRFEIKDRRVDLKRIAVSAPALGIQGDGWVGFDKKLELKAVAAPLADWKDQMKRTKIPIISDVAGEVLGALQAMVNGASKTLLYEFKITGTTKEPKVETVPAPVLTEGVAKLFGAMIKGEKLSEAIGGNANGQKK
jgi:hypothetical protein